MPGIADAVVTAARMAAQAAKRHMQILCSEAVYEAFQEQQFSSDSRLKMTHAGQTILKGSTSPTQLYFPEMEDLEMSLRPRRSRSTGMLQFAENDVHPLKEPEKGMQQHILTNSTMVFAALKMMLQPGCPQHLLLLDGPSGMGKEGMIDQVHSWTEAYHVHQHSPKVLTIRVSCDSRGHSVPFFTCEKILVELSRLLGADSEPVLNVLVQVGIFLCRSPLLDDPDVLLMTEAQTAGTNGTECQRHKLQGKMDLLWAMAMLIEMPLVLFLQELDAMPHLPEFLERFASEVDYAVAIDSLEMRRRALRRLYTRMIPYSFAQLPTRSVLFIDDIHWLDDESWAVMTCPNVWCSSPKTWRADHVDKRSCVPGLFKASRDGEEHYDHRTAEPTGHCCTVFVYSSQPYMEYRQAKKQANFENLCSLRTAVHLELPRLDDKGIKVVALEYLQAPEMSKDLLELLAGMWL